MSANILQFYSEILLLHEHKYIYKTYTCKHASFAHTSNNVNVLLQY